MKRLALWLVLSSVALAPDLRAESTPDAEFLQIYDQIQQAESFETRGLNAQAAERFQKIQAELQAFAKAHPAWNDTIIRFRLGFVKDKLATLQNRPPANSTPSILDTLTPIPPTTAVATGTSKEQPPMAVDEAIARAEAAELRAKSAETRADAATQRADEAAARVNELSDRSAQLALDLREARDRQEVLEVSNRSLEATRSRLERDQTVLEAKLKEAFHPKAAAVDPAELARAQERTLLLMKENAILRASLDHQMAQTQELQDKARKSLDLERELASTRTELSAQSKQTEELKAERQKLLAKVESGSRKGDESTVTLKNEIASLRKELSAAKAGGNSRSNSKADPDADAPLTTLKQELAEQRADADSLRRENASLRREIDKLTDIGVTPASLKIAEVPGSETNGAESLRFRRLERERDELRHELQSLQASVRQSEAGASAEARRSQDLTRQVEDLEARMRVLSAKPEPYSAEELRLFQAPTKRESLPNAGATPPVQLAQAQAQGTEKSAPPETPKAPESAAAPATNAPAAASAATSNSTTNSAATASAPARRRSVKDLPPGAGILAAQAQRAFANRRFADAEKAYREILKLDESNVYTLGNLAAILVEQGRLDDGEQFAKRALSVDTDDPFCLSLVGIIRFRQQKYDEAFASLSRSAQLDPENSETQNYLGITLSQRGERKAAEAALRKALKLNPTSAIAHYNLAVVYATQKPAYLELARYHYEKARRAGQPAMPAFEALLRGESAPASNAPAGETKPAAPEAK